MFLPKDFRQIFKAVVTIHLLIAGMCGMFLVKCFCFPVKSVINYNNVIFKLMYVFFSKYLEILAKLGL